MTTTSKFPSIPEPGASPQSQLAALKSLISVVRLLVLNASGDATGANPQTFALGSDVTLVSNNVAAESLARASAISTVHDNLGTLTDSTTSLSSSLGILESDVARLYTLTGTISGSTFHANGVSNRTTDYRLEISGAEIMDASVTGAQLSAGAATVARTGNPVTITLAEDGLVFITAGVHNQVTATAPGTLYVTIDSTDYPVSAVAIAHGLTVPCSVSMTTSLSAGSHTISARAIVTTASPTSLAGVTVSAIGLMR